MRKIVHIIVIFVIVTLFLSIFTQFFYAEERKPSEEVYTITYKAVTNGKVTGGIHTALYLEDGEYPTEYKEEDGATVSELCKDPVFVADNIDQMFQGWYLDAACTKAFDGVIEVGTTGDIILYAKILKGYWSKYY